MTTESFDDLTSEERKVATANLRARAKALGIEFAPATGAEKLVAMIAAKEAEEKTSNSPIAVTKHALSEKEQRRLRKERLRREATKLIRIEVNNMNPSRSTIEGDIFEAGNSVVGQHTKFVQFNTPWHVPVIIYNMIKDKECQIFIKKRNAKGDKIAVSKMIKEYSVTLLDPLTTKEMTKLSREQSMRTAGAED